jgi:uncharacterized protein
MWNLRWVLALPLALAVSVGSAHASSIRDEAGMFSPETVRAAEAKLKQLESETGLTTTIETIDSLRGESLDRAAIERAQRTNTEGIFILIPKQEHKIKVLASRPFARALSHERLQAIEQAFINSFKKGDFDAGLMDGVQAIMHEVEQARVANGGRLRQAEAPIAPIQRRAVARPRANANGFGIGSLLGIGLIILAVLIGIRLLGALFGRGQGAYGPGMGRPGMGPGYGGPGYGAPGGGGFMSSLFGGIGGALAGNWLYDQFSGRHHGGTVDNSSYTPGADAAPTDAAGDDWSTGSSATGDWGGGDAGGGGGDWGGGGGDWGGGGGGGGDWGGGGGGDGGSW